MSEPRQKKRQRQTLVCEFCKKRKVKCDKGNPCSTCQKYGNKNCHYADNPLQGSSNANASMQLDNRANFQGNIINGHQSANASANGNINGNYNGNMHNGLRRQPDGPLSVKSELEQELESLKQKIKSIEQSVTSIATDLSPSSTSSSLAAPANGNINNTSSASSVAPVPALPTKSNSGGIKTLANIIDGSSAYSRYIANVETTRPDLGSGHVSQGSLPGSEITFMSTDPDAPSMPVPPIKQDPTTLLGPDGSDNFSSFIGRNPVASSYDTINFYAGYTPIQDKEPLRRVNFGPLSWVSLLRKDRALRLIWDYVEIKKKHNDKMKAYQIDNNATKTERHFNQMLTESFGLNDVKLYKEGQAKGDTGKNDSETKNETTGTTQSSANDNTAAVAGGTECPHKESTTATANGSSANPPLLFPLPHINTNNMKSKFNQHGMPLGISFYTGEISNHLALADKIELILPNESVVWLLIERFFTHVYPLFPVIDEVAFKTTISDIIGPEGYDNKKKIKITLEKKLDLANLGILLYMLRVSYLTLLTTVDSENEKNLNSLDQSPSAQRLKFLLNNPINLDVVDSAQVCLNQFNLHRKVNMTIMQLAFFSRIYHMYAPEDGDGADGGDAASFTATLIQMALSLGLNREPDLFPNACNNEKVNNIGRKMWYLLIIFDLNNCMSLGTPLNIHRSSFDTKFPFYKKGNENILDVELEKKILSSAFPRIERIYEPMVDIITLVLDINANVNMAQLAERLNYVETYFIQEYGRLRRFFDDSGLDEDSSAPAFVKTLKMKIYFNANFFLVTLYFHFFCYYESKQNFEYAFYYLKKIFVITVGDLMPYYFELLENNPRIFRDSTDLMVTPGFEVVLHKSLICCNAVMIRVRMNLFRMARGGQHDTSLHNDEDYATHFSKLTKLDQSLQKCSKIFLEAISRLSKRYYYAWRISKGGSYINDLLRGKEFYDFVLERSDAERKSGVEEGSELYCLKTIKFTVPMLDDLYNLLDGSLSRVPGRRRKKQKTDSNYYNPNVPGFGNKNEGLGSQQAPNVSSGSDTQLPRSSSSGSANSGDPQTVGSTGSSSFSDNYYNDIGGESIDNLWLQMLTIKRGDNNPNNNFNFEPNSNSFQRTSGFGNEGNMPSFDYYAQTPSELKFQAETPGVPTANSANFGTDNNNNINPAAGNGNAVNYADVNNFDIFKDSELDFFQILPFEDVIRYRGNME